MAENIVENTKKPIFDRVIQTYDQEIINSPDWLSVKDIEKIIGMGDRTVRNYAKAGNWRKKYAKVDGSPMVYFAKEDVHSYLKTNNLIDESKIEDSQLKEVPTESGPAKQNQNPLENSLDPQIFSKEIALRVESALSVHKEALKRLQDTEDKLIKAEQSRVTWKINAFWSIAFTVLGTGTLGILLFNASKVSTELTKNYNDLTAKYENSQDSLLNAKESILEKDDLLMKIQNNTLVTNATRN